MIAPALAMQADIDHLAHHRGDLVQAGPPLRTRSRLGLIGAIASLRLALRARRRLRGDFRSIPFAAARPARRVQPSGAGTAAHGLRPVRSETRSSRAITPSCRFSAPRRWKRRPIFTIPASADEAAARLWPGSPRAARSRSSRGRAVPARAGGRRASRSMPHLRLQTVSSSSGAGGGRGGGILTAGCAPSRPTCSISGRTDLSQAAR
jgi:hypothetical protein